MRPKIGEIWACHNSEFVERCPGLEKVIVSDVNYPINEYSHLRHRVPNVHYIRADGVKESTPLDAFILLYDKLK